jgi:hypothetical protein
MDRPAFLEHNDALAWMILGYLSSNPDAKDTVDGIEKWWLNAMDIGMDARTVRGSLDHLVKLGWLVAYQRLGSGVVYGLNRDRREKLRRFLESAADLG